MRRSCNVFVSVSVVIKSSFSIKLCSRKNHSCVSSEQIFPYAINLNITEKEHSPDEADNYPVLRNFKPEIKVYNTLCLNFILLNLVVPFLGFFFLFLVAIPLPKGSKNKYYTKMTKCNNNNF